MVKACKAIKALLNQRNCTLDEVRTATVRHNLTLEQESLQIAALDRSILRDCTGIMSSIFFQKVEFDRPGERSPE